MENNSIAFILGNGLVLSVSVNEVSYSITDDKGWSSAAELLLFEEKSGKDRPDILEMLGCEIVECEGVVADFPMSELPDLLNKLRGF